MNVNESLIIKNRFTHVQVWALLIRVTLQEISCEKVNEGIQTCGRLFCYRKLGKLCHPHFGGKVCDGLRFTLQVQGLGGGR